MSRYQIGLGDSLEWMAGLEENSLDSLVTDPPAGVSFMNKKFDSFKSRDAFVQYLIPIFKECYRVLKPGSHGLVWCLPRTAHWTKWALEEAGFFIVDDIAHMFSTGFPKSHNIAKAIQKKSGVKPIGELPPSLGMANNPQWHALNRQLIMPEPEGEAAKWEGFGTALKPGREDWVLVQKPISEKTIADNVLKWGVGGINIGACRVQLGIGTGSIDDSALAGRYPSNVVFSHSDDCKLIGTKQVQSGKAFRENSGGKNIHSDVEKPALPNMSYANEDGLEEVELWECSTDCPVGMLDAQGPVAKPKKGRKGKRGGSPIHGSPTIGSPEKDGNWPADAGGGLSRFYYCAKAAKSEKEAGCEHLQAKTAAELTGRKEGSLGLVMQHTDGSEKANPYAGTSGAEPRKNHHPTVKNLSLMSYLCRLVTPPNGVVLDPFMGSGSTGVAAIKEGFQFIGVEKEPDYYEIAKARLAHAEKELTHG